MSQFEQALEDVAAGGAVDPELADEVGRVNMAALDESAGEGYHRASNIVRSRCAGASSAYIKQSTRFSENLTDIRAFLKQHKHAGRQVIRFEWSQYKRILQTERKYQWSNKRLGVKGFFDRMYKQDTMALANLGLFFKRCKT